ncbi:FAD-dependent monooxygenase [Streptomyces pinistramenti]|uniref:FAD-dependent monooxygenase n=1 Tax=Streptomyces pinistramenti TaxID=2884812 RepID=UPI001D085637|nr:FAD-dependent monooxygenase [Streptomyces pinistramenti]MCB5909999.1 FAD-dependent monooxygenase [Streptomyces pinistramenti]
MDASVIVVGAGPAGLMLAGELRLAGVDVVVLDRLERRTGESRGIGLTPRTVEVFDQRGLLPRFGDIETSSQGHFGGIPLDFAVLGGGEQAARTVPQSVTESVLESWARDLGADIRRGHEFVAVTDNGDHVDVQVRGPAGQQVLTSRYLAGCDGGRSSVRKAVGFDFPGTAATTELFLADIRGVDLEPRMVADRVTGGMVMTARLGDGIHRVIVAEHGAPPRRRTGPPPFAEVADVWKRLTGIDISHAEPVWVSAFGDATRQVTEYRRGRVLLAGDAAHIHLPAGGQGMNTSIQDAVNLGWKLAAVLHGTAGPALLDTYHSERHEVGRRLLANTRAQSLLILGSEDVQPLRDILTELTQYEEVARHFAAKAGGLDIRYDTGNGSSPLLGRRMPRLELLRGSRTVSHTELLHPGRGVLLDLADTPQLRRRATAWADRVDIITAVPQSVSAGSELDGVSSVLLRPDGHVAWAAPGSHHDLPMALERWFGPARQRVTARTRAA